MLSVTSVGVCHVCVCVLVSVAKEEEKKNMLLELAVHVLPYSENFFVANFCYECQNIPIKILFVFKFVLQCALVCNSPQLHLLVKAIIFIFVGVKSCFELPVNEHDKLLR